MSRSGKAIFFLATTRLQTRAELHFEFDVLLLDRSKPVDRFFRVRVFLVFAVLGIAIGMLAFVTSTRSMAETGRVPITRFSDRMPADELIGTSVDPMDTMGTGAETPTGTSSIDVPVAPAFATDVAQSS